MCGIAGFCSFQQRFTEQYEENLEKLTAMQETLRRRGPDDGGVYLAPHCALAHRRLSIIDLSTGQQPMLAGVDGRRFALVYNGELYNMNELKSALKSEGIRFETTSDTEVLLKGLAHHGIRFVEQLNGIFAFAFWDGESLYLCRDRAGVKPLFYTMQGDTLLFGSEPKALLAYPGVSPVIDLQGLRDIFVVGPARRPDSGVFKGFYSIEPGQYAVFDAAGLHKHRYWTLTSREHRESYADTVAQTGALVQDAVSRQLISDVPVCSFLSGGVDSTVVTAIAADELKKHGRPMHSFSFDFDGNDQYFHSNAFQPDRDRPWVEQAVKAIGTKHSFLECNTQEMADMLYDAVDAKDLPGMADVDSSLLYFCKRVGQEFKVTLTGECADEIFGGYPWFHSKEAFERASFPWSWDMDARTMLLDADLVQALDAKEYNTHLYLQSLAQVPAFEGDNAEERRRREISYLNLRWFMATLLERMDRTSMYAGLEARVPFADHRIIEYLWNVPWRMKCKDGTVKGLLRESMRGVLPDELLFRKKSPYPKSYHPQYETILGERLLDVLGPSSPLAPLVDLRMLNRFIGATKDYGRPWFGQLMAGPQMLAYLLQIDYWLKKYHVKLEL